MLNKLRKPWRHILVLTLVSVLGIAAMFFYYYPLQKLLQANDELGIVKTRYINGLDGRVVNSKEDSALQVIAVMIDNHPDARPGSALSKAKIVYEAPVEGGITRYMAIFDNKQSLPEIGPVRSARAYFLDWLQEYGDALYVHVGGSPEALALIGSRNIFAANEFFRGSYFWRSSQNFAPHNLYTNSENLGKIIAQEGSTSSLFTMDKAWKYSRTVGTTIGTTTLLKIPFTEGYTVGWAYDAKTLNYVRSINGYKQKDRDGSEVTARNILVQITAVGNIANDDAGRKALVTVGSGEAIILKKGSITYGTWQKTSLTDRTRFYTKEGKEILLVPGNTWVEVVPKEVNIQI